MFEPNVFRRRRLAAWRTGTITLLVLSRLSNWHAMVIEAAQRSSAQALFGEDLGHGRRFGSVTVLNLFRVAGQ